MSLYGMMRTSVSGMNAQAERLATVSDNIANSGTVGYKRNSIEFSTQVLNSSAGQYNSGSVGTSHRAFISSQGALRATTSSTDLAINGNGFFIVQDGSDDFFLTRAGSFLIDSTGNLVNSAGNTLLGYDLSTTGAPPVANGFGGLSPINVGLQTLTAVPTTAMELLPNLPANAAITTAGTLPSDNVANSAYDGKTSLLLYDNVGNERIVDIYFAKTAADTWEAVVYDHDTATSGGFPYTGPALAQTSISFDPSSGQVLGGGATTMSFTVPNGAVADLDLTGVTQLGADFQVIGAQSNGSSPASIERVEIDDNGTVYGIFENGYTEALYQLALADVPSPDNLAAMPGNSFAITIDSGDVLIGIPERDALGSIVSGVLEESNVDMATELTIMIESQRSYTANSKVFQTGSDLMDVLINLKR